MALTPTPRKSLVVGDQRRHKRVELVLPARFMLPDRSEHDASLLDISAGGISLKTDQRPPKGTPVIVYVKEIGRLEGAVVRHHTKGFAVEFDVNQVQRDRLVEKLTVHLNRPFYGDIENRAYVRVSADQAAQLVLADGRTINCRVLDMSFGGVSLEVGIYPAVGEKVLIGRMRGRVVRHHENGIGVAFDDVHTSWGSLTRSVKSSPDV